MSETNTQEVNKAAAIRVAMELFPNAKPAEIVEYLKNEKGIEVSTMYVYTVRQSKSRKEEVQFEPPSFEAVRLAKRLVKEVGSIAAARNVLDGVTEEIDQLSETRNRYTVTLNEIDSRLDDKERPLTAKDRQELFADRRKIASLLKSLENL